MTADQDPDLARVTSRLQVALGDALGKLRVTDAVLLAGFTRPSYRRGLLVARALRGLGWKRGRYRFDGELAYAYARGTPLERETVLAVERGDGGKLVVNRREP